MGELAVRAIVLRAGKLLVVKRDKFGKKYITLPGGAVEPDESPEQAVVRELKEETCLNARVIHKVYEQNPYLGFPRQYIYLCEVKSTDEPVLDKQSIEYELGKNGNCFEPVYLTLDGIASLPEPFFPEQLLDEIKAALGGGFPKNTKTIC